MQRKIIHCDADCFFAAIEMRDDPLLRDRPLAVGGSSAERGVISTCNYEARAYGVRSAMASAHARRLCPNLLIVPHNMAKYRAAAQTMRDIFHDYSDQVEPLSLDEAFLDVTESSRCRGSATLMAEEIRQRIHAALGITVSTGVAPNKFLAKVASEWRKPNGGFVITPAQVDDFMPRLPVTRIHGVGKVTAARMFQLGLRNCGDLQALSQAELAHLFGSFGPSLYQLCRGIDQRDVCTDHSRKSLSVEHTFAQDLCGESECLAQLPDLFGELHARMMRLDRRYRVAKAFAKVKFDDFTTTTIEQIGTQARLTSYRQLIAQAAERRPRPVRLLGIGVRLIDQCSEELARQLPLFS